jgi:signal transduction histidine kinase/CheY-like chemotaxis protein
MIVEDHALSRQVLYNLFTSLGHRVVEATDGETALGIVQSNHPDLIISDILLPNLDGIEFARQLRGMPDMEDLPIIFYTATCRLQGELSLGQKCGTCRVIPKPSDPHYILATVNEMLEKNGKQASSAIPPPAASYFAKSDYLSSGLQLATLMDLSSSIISQSNPEQLLGIASRAVGELLNCNSLLTINLDDGGKRYYWGRGGSEVCSLPHGMPETVPRQVMREIAPVRWGPIGNAAGFGMAMPFATAGCAYGWHCIWDDDRIAAFSEREEELALTLSTHCALAYENILLFEAKKKHEQHLEALVEERTAKLKQAKTELYTAQKLESLGVLAGGIAHNFNNALTAILGHIQIAKILSNYEDEIINNLNLAEEACVNAHNLTKQLLTFAKGGKPVKEVTALGPLLRDTALFVLEDSEIDLKLAITPGLVAVDIDKGQINQVVANLILNAQQSMPQGGGILIKADNVCIDEDNHLPVQPGNYVHFSVSDSGIGIAPENINNVFDPFFTTKEQGNGLGLAIAFSIVSNHEGYISVESHKGRGTIFNVYLPASKTEPGVLEERPVNSNGGHILIIEDNRIIAQTLSELLSMHGYRVDWAGDGAKGLKLYQKGMIYDKFDAVIMDLIIPGGMGGRETILELQKLDPYVRAVVISGYSNDPVMADFKKFGFKAAFPKPFNIKELVLGLQKLIAEEN